MGILLVVFEILDVLDAVALVVDLLVALVVLDVDLLAFALGSEVFADLASVVFFLSAVFLGSEIFLAIKVLDEALLVDELDLVALVDGTGTGLAAIAIAGVESVSLFNMSAMLVPVLGDPSALFEADEEAVLSLSELLDPDLRN